MRLKIARALPISWFFCSMRLRKAGEAQGLINLGNFAALQPEEFQTWRNVGETTLKEISGLLAEFGLDFGDNGETADLGEVWFEAVEMVEGNFKQYILKNYGDYTIDSIIEHVLDFTLASDSIREGVKLRIGLEGESTTLAVAGSHSGVTRERIRQAEGKVRKNLICCFDYCTPFRKAIAILDEAYYLSAIEISESLHAEGLIRNREGDLLRFLITAANGLDGRPDLNLTAIRTERYLLEKGWESSPETAELAQAHRRSVCGFLAIPNPVSAPQRLFLKKCGFEVIEEHPDYAWKTGGSRTILTALKKALAVSSGFSIESLRERLISSGRNRNAPSTELIAWLIRNHSSEASTEYNKTVVRTATIDPGEILSETELVIYRAFQEKNINALSVEQIMDFAAEQSENCNLSTIYQSLYLSPFLENNPGSTIRYLIGSMRSGSDPNQPVYRMKRRSVNLEFGWTNGKIWLIRSIRPGTSTYPISIPGELAGSLSEGDYTLVSPCISPIRLRQQVFEGLGPILRRHFTPSHTRVLLLLDPNAKTVQLSLGNESSIHPPLEHSALETNLKESS